jgi:crossover junction endodeoxyribonuclease RuvC
LFAAEVLVTDIFYTKGMRILGIDPGTGILGFGVVDSSAGAAKFVDAGVIRTPVNEADTIRLNTIFEEIVMIIKQAKPDVMSIEKLFFLRNVTTAMTVSQARGVVLLAAVQNKLPVFEYTPLQIKQAVTGYGRADKQQVQEMVKVLLGLKYLPQPDDAADALAAAITHGMTVR